MKFHLCSAWIAVAVFSATIATNALATIQPKRVGPVSQYGALQAAKNSAGEGRIYGSVDGAIDGKEVQLRGMSLSWSQNWPWGVSFYGNTYIDTLVGGWNVELVRSAMGTVAPWGQGVYMTRPEYYEAKMDTVVQAAIETSTCSSTGTVKEATTTASTRVSSPVLNSTTTNYALPPRMLQISLNAWPFATESTPM